MEEKEEEEDEENANISSDCRTSHVDLHQCQSRCNPTLDIPDKQTSMEGEDTKSHSKHVTFLIINLRTATAWKNDTHDVQHLHRNHLTFGSQILETVGK